MKNQPVRQDQTTTLGTTCPTLYSKFVGSLMCPANDGAYSLKSLWMNLESNLTKLIAE